MRARLLCLVLALPLLVSVTSAQNTTYTFDEIGLTIQLPANWVRDDEQAVDDMNTQARARSPLASFMYMAKFSRQPASEGYPTFMLIQKTPGRASSKQLLEMFPKLKPKIQVSVNDAYSDINADSQVHDPYLDEYLGLIVLPVSISMGEIKAVGRSYMIPMDKNMVSINVYTSPDNAKEVFAEVEPLLKSIQLDENLKLKENWMDSLHTLISQ